MNAESLPDKTFSRKQLEAGSSGEMHFVTYSHVSPRFMSAFLNNHRGQGHADVASIRDVSGVSSIEVVDAATIRIGALDRETIWQVGIWFRHFRQRIQDAE